MTKRIYKSGSRFAFWRWSAAPSGYIERLHLLQSPWFGIFMHWINGPDPEPDKHDHPRTFLSLILKGWYEEIRVWKYGWIPQSVRWWNFIRATDAHKIIAVAPGGVITLAIMGPADRKWGFHTKDGWMFWKDYNRKYKV